MIYQTLHNLKGFTSSTMFNKRLSFLLNCSTLNFVGLCDTMLCMGNVDGALTVSFVIFTDLAVFRLSDFAALCCLVIEHRALFRFSM